jgi:cytochrome P450
MNGLSSDSSTDASSQEEQHHKTISSFRETMKKGITSSIDHSTLSGVLDAVRNINSLDDRKLLLEHVLVIMSKLPEGAMLTKLQNATVELLYNDLPHPSATFIGPKYAWRAADGSNNNVFAPDMGKAGMPYGRSVQQGHPLPRNSLPDAGLVFDTLLKREGFVKHPAGLSSMMFSFAALVIHTVFRTSHTDVNINETSSYVDLAPLYGHNQEAQDKVRLRDGRGFLKPDVFAEDRLLFLPPAVCVILVLFSRNHNFIANKLIEVNERNTFFDPASLSPDDPKKNAKLLAQEEELFQTARLINCAWFGSVIFSDYFSSILGLPREGSNWSLNPFGEIRKDDHSLFERGQGNVCSVEFNCLYRWHATTSAEDEKWVETAFQKLFADKTPETVTANDFRIMAQKLQATEPDIEHWTFGGLTRQEDGTFRDQDLANVLHNATEHPAAAFGARGTPAVMRLHEIMGIEQNRRWGVCSLNEFRKFLGLKTYNSFKEWNPRPEIYTAAEKLYGHIDHLELYVGLQAEETKPVVEGAGLCPGYTISRAILSDAIALTRGDRFFTADYTPFNLTAWGFADAQRDPNGAGFGSMLGRLFLRTLPENYDENSVYTWFPLMTPDSMKTNLTKLDKAASYSFVRPKGQAPVKVVSDHAQVTQVLKNTAVFQTPYPERAGSVLKGNGFFLASADATRSDREQREIVSALVHTPDIGDKIAESIYRTTQDLITYHSYACVGGKVMNVDIVRDVLRYAPLTWAATEVAGISLKTAETPHGLYTESELFDKLSDIYSFLFLETDPAKLMITREQVKASVAELLRHIKTNLSIGGGQRFSVAGIVDTISQIFLSNRKKSDRQDLLKRLYDIGHDSDQLANSVLAILIGSTVELSLVLTNTVNFFLDHDQAKELRALSTSTDAKSIAQLQGYAWEASRLDPPFRGVYRIAQQEHKMDTLTIAKNERVFLDVAAASLNEQAYTNATAVDPARPRDRYLNAAVNALGDELTSKILSQVIRAVFGLQGVRRGPGLSGVLSRFKDDSNPILRYGYVNDHSQQGAWPISMIIQYDPAPPSPTTA